MSRGPVNSQAQKFWEETYDKETHARLSYFKHKSSADSAGESKQFEVFKKKIEAACPKPTEALLKLRHHKPVKYNRRRANYDGNLDELKKNLKPVDSSMLIEMYPPPERQRTLLYDGFSKQGKGRHQYLQSRYRGNIPEEKYQYQSLSSWDYGWRLNDPTNGSLVGKSPHGRNRIVADTFYTRNGIPTLHSAAF